MKSIGQKFSLLLIITLACFTAKSQQPYSIALGDIRPIPDKVVYSIFQDSKGYIWTATNSGLFKYDGFQHTIYHSEIQTSKAGGNIREDAYGRIWYQNFDGYLYYVENGKLHSLKQNLPPDYTSYGITDQMLYVIQKAGVDIFDLKTLALIKTVAFKFSRVEHTAVFSGYFYVMADDILYRIDTKGNKINSHYFTGKNLHIKYLFSTKDHLYVASKNNETRKIYFFDQHLNFVKTESTPSLNRIQGSDVIDDQIWLHSTNGTYLLNQGKKLPLDQNILPQASVSQMIKDYKGNLWISSINNGIYLIRSLKEQVFNHDNFTPKTLIKSSNGYLIGTEDGRLLELDKQFNKRKTLYQEQSSIPVYYIFKDEKDNNIIFSHNGFSILNTVSKRRIHYDIALKETVKLDDKYYAIATSGVIGLLKNPSAASNTASIWDKVYHEETLPTAKGISALKTNLRAKSVAWDAENQRILTTSNIGTFMITPNGEQEIKYKNASFFAQKIHHKAGETYLIDTKGQLYRLKEDLSLENLTQLWNINSAIYNFRSDSDAITWRTKHLAYRYADNRLETQALNAYLNILDVWFNDRKVYILTDKHILNNTTQSNSHKEKTLFYIDSVQVNGQLTSKTTPINLAFNQNNVTVYFSALEFLDKNINLQYSINGGQWVGISQERRSIEFPSLSAGTYKIAFKLGDELVSDTISFKIALPFWKQWAFYLISSLIGIGIVLYYYDRRSSFMQHQIKLLDEKIHLEQNLKKSALTAIKSQMNPHFFYNALNTIQAYIFTNDRDRASNYLAKFSKLTRMILEMSEKESITLAEEITALSLYLELEQMRFQENFQFNIDVAPYISKDEVEIPPMLLQPYVENAVKHGLLHKEGSKNLNIQITMSDNDLFVQIEDNGIGRKRSAELNSIKNKNHTSFATQANERRIEILNKGRQHKIGLEIKDLEDQNQQAIGTRVSISIPTQ